MKRLLTFVLALALVFGTMSFAVAAPSDVADDAAYKAAVERLMSLEIVKGYEDGTYRPDNVVTRAEFATLVVKVLGLEGAAEFSGSLALFTDVTADAWYAGFVNVAASQGLLKGYPDGTFQPMNVVSYPEALTILVRALGYGEDDVIGSWPLNYIVKAADVGVSDDVTITSAGANRGSVALLIDNTLMTDVKKADADDPDETLLEKKLGVEEKELLVLGVYGADYTDSDLEKNEVVLSDGNVYTVSQDMLPLLGQEITALVKDDVLVNAVATGDTKAVKVDEDDFVSAVADVTDTYDVTVTYEVGDKEKTYTVLDPNTIPVDCIPTRFIVNTKWDDDYDPAASLDKAAEFTIVDFNKDDLADFVFVKQYKELWSDSLAYEFVFVDEINVKDKVIALETGAPIELDDEDIVYVIYKDGKEIDLDDIDEGDTVYVAESEDGLYVEILVVDEEVKGTIDEIDGTKYYVDGEKYSKTIAAALSVGDEGTFKIGRNDDIIDFDVESIEAESYGYLVAFSDIEDDFTTGKIVSKKLKVGTQGDEKVIFELADEVTLITLAADGTVAAEDRDVDVEDDLDVANPTPKVEPFLTGLTYFRYSVNSDNEITVMEDISLAMKSANAVNVNFDYDKIGAYYVADDTVLFQVDGTGYQGVVDFSKLNEDYVDVDIQAYDIVVFDADEFNEVAFIAVTNTDLDLREGDEVVVVDRVTTSLNDDGNPVQKLYAWLEGEGKSYLAENKTVINEVYITKGSIVSIEFNAEGEMDEVIKAVYVDGPVFAKKSGKIKIGSEVYVLADNVYVYEYDNVEDEVYTRKLIDVRAQTASVPAKYVQAYLNSDDEVEVLVIITSMSDCFYPLP